MRLSEPLAVLFEKYKANILQKTYFPQTVEETLFCRAASLYYLISDNNRTFKAAVETILKTSTNKADLTRLLWFANEIDEWLTLDVNSVYDMMGYRYCEYTMRYRDRDGKLMTRHVHAKYEREKAGYRFISQQEPQTRLIGDSILHQSPRPFPSVPSASELEELHQQIDIATKLLVETGGVGIAANQCAAIRRPYAFAIVGVYHRNEQHMKHVEARYPGEDFPEAILMINPTVVASSSMMKRFKHGCLSVPGKIRAEIETPETVKVAYLTLTHEERFIEVIQTFSGNGAVVCQHELNHLQGHTYIDIWMQSLPISDRQQLAHALRGRSWISPVCTRPRPDLTNKAPFLMIGTSATQGTQLESGTLKEALQRCATDEMVAGFKARLDYHCAEQKTAERQSTPPCAPSLGLMAKL